MVQELKRITLTREELYEKLWQTPTKHVVKEFGMSNVMLGKLCKEYLIHKRTSTTGPRRSMARIPVPPENSIRE